MQAFSFASIIDIKELKLYNKGDLSKEKGDKEAKKTKF